CTHQVVALAASQRYRARDSRGISLPAQARTIISSKLWRMRACAASTSAAASARRNCTNGSSMTREPSRNTRARLLAKVLHSTQCHPNGRRDQGIGKDDAKGQTKEGTIIDRGPRVAEVKRIEVRQGAVLRYERLLDHNVLTPSTAQAHD